MDTLELRVKLEDAERVIRRELQGLTKAFDFSDLDLTVETITEGGFGERQKVVVTNVIIRAQL